MTNLDRIIGYFSPQAGVRRIQSRLAFDYLSKKLDSEQFAYEAARAGRRTSGWLSSSSSANAEVGAGLSAVRNRSRELCRNNRYGRKAVKELSRAIVGTGIELQAKTGDPDLDKIIQEEWKWFVDECDSTGRLDFYGLQDQAARAIVESGEIFARFRPRLIRDGLRVPLQLQTLEADFVDHTKTESLKDGYVIEGIECDWLDRRRAYHVYGQHPGEVVITNPRGYYQTFRVPSSEIVHAYYMERPHQFRGMPWLAAVMLNMRDLDDYDEAVRLRKKAEACVVAFVTQGVGDEGAGPALGIQTTETSGSASVPNRTLEKMAPGMIARLSQGQDVKFNSPQASGDGGYRTSELQGISAGCDVTYERMSADYSNVNFSSWRGGDNSFKNNIQAFQWLMFAPMYLKPIWSRFIDVLERQGKIPYETSRQVEYHMPPFPSIDPKGDAEAEELQIRAGTKTYIQSIIERGRDPEEHCKEIDAGNKLMDKYGIVSDADPRRTPKRGTDTAAEPAASPSPPPPSSGKSASGKPNGKPANSNA